MKSLLPILFLFIAVFDIGSALDAPFKDKGVLDADNSEVVISHQANPCYTKREDHPHSGPFDCHDCVGHCHSPHSTMFSDNHETAVVKPSSIMKTRPLNRYKNPYKSVYLNSLFRPPIFS